MKREIIENITGRAAFIPYFGSYTYELAGKSFEVKIPGLGVKKLSAEKEKLVFDGKESTYQAVKCDDEVYLLGFDGKLLLFCACCGEGILSSDAFYAEALSDNVLFDWETEIHFGAHLDYMVEFSAEEVKIGGESFPAAYAKLGEDLYAAELQTEEGKLLLVLDLARFLVYGGLDGTVTVGACIEVPEGAK